MLEKFPQLKRLERLLVKAQTFSPRKPKQAPSVSGAEAKVEAMDTPTTSHREPVERTSYLDTFESMAEACQRPAKIKEEKSDFVAREKSLYDSDDLLDFKRPTEVSCGKPNGKESTSVKKTRAWKTLRSPREVLQMRGYRSSRRMNRFDRSPLRSRNAVPVKLVDSTRKRLFQRKMQEAIPSDLLCALSEEEYEDHDEAAENPTRPKTLRFPLPTMPLSIMVPVQDLPDSIVPIDFETVTEKLSGYDQSIGPLMDTRNRLATSYTMYNELCTSFQGAENLDTFLRSLVHSEAEESTAKEVGPSNPANARSRSVPKAVRKQQTKFSLPPSNVREGTLTCSTGSRLCRPTVSTKMKQVDSSQCRPQHNMFAQMSLTGSTASSNQRSITVKEHRPKNAMKTIKKQKDETRYASPQPPPEEDAREDMLQRVRRGLMGLSWLGRARRNSNSQAVASPVEIPACW